jgi:1-phosphatidylinositol phosphodiesterase
MGEEMTQFTIDAEKWMGSIDSSCFVSELSIPGTHDSGATLKSFVGQCQSMDIKKQLKCGVRFLDIRCIVKKDELKVYHGIINEFLSFEQLLNYCYNFLKKNQTETILFCLKNEDSKDEKKFEEIFIKHVEKNPNQWHLEETIPQLKMVRGKIVLFRRFSKTNGKMGIDVSHSWKNNNPRFEIKLFDGSVIIQDKYEVKSADEKFGYVKTLLEEAIGIANSSQMYLNFASGYVKILGVPSVSKVSNGVNADIQKYFKTNPKGKYGSVLMDFVKKEVVNQLICSNF